MVSEPWLPVITLGGEREILSVRSVLGRAHELRAVQGDLGTQTFALVRLLVAILHRAVNGPRDVEQWEGLWKAARLPDEAINAYLEQHKSHFELFDAEAPFFQVASLRTARDETFELNRLIADVPNGRPFFASRPGKHVTLSFAEAARWLVHCQAFDPSGIKSGAVGDDRVRGGRGYPIGLGWSGNLGGVLAEGRTLRETLLLNLVRHEKVGDDLPAWEREPLTSAVRASSTPSGPVDLFTWQSRRIRLVPQDGVVRSVLVCNGDPLEPQNKHHLEPHSRWRRSPAQEKKRREAVVYMPLEHNPERVVWRGLQSMLASTAGAGQGREATARWPGTMLEWLAELIDAEVVEPDFPLQLRTIGMVYGSNNSVTDEVVDDVLALHATLLRQDAALLAGVAVSCVEATDAAVRAVGKLALTLAQAAGKAPPNGGGIPAPEDVAQRTRATETAYAELDQPFRRWLAALNDDTDSMEAQQAWHQRAYRLVSDLGDDLVRQTPAAGWSGHQVGNRMITVAHAVEWFRRDLADALPYAQSLVHTRSAP
nr:type I-E CRISPR-associated protein Cse1/CasA [Amycolatopsis granulosa]